MKQADFDKLLEHRLVSMRIILKKKSADYSTDEDKLHNFKRAGQMEDCTPEKALIGMWTKHIISILDIIDELEIKCSDETNYFPAYEPYGYVHKLEEKITDAINYLILLEALIKERLEIARIDAGF